MPIVYPPARGKAGPMKYVISGIAFVLLAGLAIFVVLWTSRPVEDAFMSRLARAHIVGERTDLLHDGALHIVLCGTGSPLPDPGRASACIAVVAAGHVVLVDSGPGSTLRL